MKATDLVVVRNESRESVSNKTMVSAKELIDMEIEDVPRLWEPALLRVGISILAGSSDCGKSTLARQLALAVCRKDTEFLGSTLNIRQGKAIIVATEDDLESIASNIRKQTKKERDKAFTENLHFVFDSDNIVDDLDKELEKSACDIVVVDTWGDAFKGNSNDLSNVRQDLHKWRELSRKHQCQVLLLHHTIKHSEKFSPDKNRLNGSQGIEAKARAFIELRQTNDPKERALTVLKCNHMSNEEKSKSLIIQFDEETLTFSNTGKKVDKTLIGQNALKRYDESILIEALGLRKTGLSYSQTRESMIEKFGEENVPKLTWFKENCK